MECVMKDVKLILSFFFFLFSFLSYQGQNKPIGSWSYYFNNPDYFDIENIEGNIMVNAKRAIFDVKLNPMETIALDRTTGLSDYSISTMAYKSSEKILLVAYGNTMIDVIDFSNGKKKIKPNYDVFNKLIVADKTILSVKFIDSMAFLASKVGVIVFDYRKNEIRSTYILGNGGNYLPCYTMEKYRGKYFVATNDGVKEAMDNVAINLQDFSNWTLNTSAFPQDTFISSALLDDKMYFMSKTQLISTDGADPANVLISSDSLRVLKRLKQTNKGLYLIYDSLIPGRTFYSTKSMKISSSLDIVFESIGRSFMDLTFANDGTSYLSGSGGFGKIESNSYKGISLSSNPFDFPFRLQWSSGKVIVNMGVMAKNLDASLNSTGHFVLEDNYIFQSGLWNDSFYGCTNQISAVERDGGLYRAFVRGGVTFEKEGQPVKRFTVTNSALDSNAQGDYRVSDMVLNSVDGSLWIANVSSSQPLKCLTKSGTWHSFDISSVASTKEIFKIVIDQAGNKWLLMRNEGLILFNEKNISNPADDIIRLYTEIPKTKTNACEASLKGVNCAVVDNEGLLWLGTEKGVGYVTGCTYDPDEPCDFDVPIQSIINLNDTTKYQECAFLNTPVTAMAVDGGNNLWVGTPDGIFYNEEALNIEYIRLNKLNSPFSAKSIHDILVHPHNGAVYISTELGLLSYRGQSITGEKNEGRSPYLIIPNPVPQDYDGLISIDGIPENAYYKITDVVGNLIYQGQSNGSRVTWDGRSLAGVKASTGVYFIFSGHRELRGNTGVGKFTIIR